MNKTLVLRDENRKKIALTFSPVCKTGICGMDEGTVGFLTRVYIPTLDKKLA